MLAPWKLPHKGKQMACWEEWGDVRRTRGVFSYKLFQLDWSSEQPETLILIIPVNTSSILHLLVCSVTWWRFFQSKLWKLRTVSAERKNSSIEVSSYPLLGSLSSKADGKCSPDVRRSFTTDDFSLQCDRSDGSKGVICSGRIWDFRQQPFANFIKAARFNVFSDPLAVLFSSLQVFILFHLLFLFFILLLLLTQFLSDHI